MLPLFFVRSCTDAAHFGQPFRLLEILTSLALTCLVLSNTNSLKPQTLRYYPQPSSKAALIPRAPAMSDLWALLRATLSPSSLMHDFYSLSVALLSLCLIGALLILGLLVMLVWLHLMRYLMYNSAGIRG